MLFSRHGVLEDYIVENLANGTYTAENLHSKYNKIHEPVTLQALYKALKKLCLDEIVVKHKENYSMNNIWKKRVVELLESSNDFPTLREGESIAYSFKSFEQLDEYWKHIQEGTTEAAATTYFFCPHQYWWFVPGRRESEIAFYESFAESKEFAVLLLGGATRTDREMKKLLSGPYIQVHCEFDHGLRMTDSLTIKNDLIIRTRLPFAVSAKINEIFNQDLPYPETESLLAEFFKKRIPVRILIEKNKQKATKLSRQMGKYFYIKK